MATKIDLPHIKSLSWTSETSHTPANIIAYNLALGAPGTDLRLSYGPRLLVPLPTFGVVPVIAVMGAVTLSLARLLLRFQPRDHIHAAHALRQLAPCPARATLRSTARVVEVVARSSSGGGGVAVIVGVWTEDAGSGRRVRYSEWTSVVLHVPSAGASAVTATASSPASPNFPVASSPLPSRPPDAVVVQAT